MPFRLSSTGSQQAGRCFPRKRMKPGIDQMATTTTMSASPRRAAQTAVVGVTLSPRSARNSSMTVLDHGCDEDPQPEGGSDASPS